MHLALKTALFTAVVVLANVLGNFFLGLGVKRLSDLASPLLYLKALFSPWIALGIALLIVWVLARMALLSWADLSYVLPVTAIGYVLSTLMAWLFLSEVVSLERWLGTVLITSGTALVGFGRVSGAQRE
jgi:uncharacterized membrane protein